MSPWVGNQVGLEFSEIHVESSIKPEGGRDGGDNLGNQTIEVGVGGSLNVQITATDVIDGLVVHHEGAVGVLEGGVGGEDRVVGFDHSSGDLRCWVDRETQLGFLPVVDGQSFQQERSKTRPCSSLDCKTKEVSF